MGRLFRKPVLFVGCLLLCSVVCAALAFRNYLAMERYVAAVQTRVTEHGKTLSAEGCVDEVIRWRKTCRGSRVFCNAYAPRVMAFCLEARDRRSYCRKLPRTTWASRFGYKDCQRRGVTRKTKKACAAAYRMLLLHCHRLQAQREPIGEVNSHGG